MSVAKAKICALAKASWLGLAWLAIAPAGLHCYTETGLTTTCALHSSAIAHARRPLGWIPPTRLVLHLRSTCTGQQDKAAGQEPTTAQDKGGAQDKGAGRGTRGLGAGQGGLIRTGPPKHMRRQNKNPARLRPAHAASTFSGSLRHRDVHSGISRGGRPWVCGDAPPVILSPPGIVFFAALRSTVPNFEFTDTRPCKRSAMRRNEAGLPRRPPAAALCSGKKAVQAGITPNAVKLVLMCIATTHQLDAT